MMSENSFSLRRTTDEDIDKICALFSNTKNSEELKWLLSYPLDDASFRSFVAVTPDNKIVGHQGYVISKYQFQGNIYIGLHPITLLVSPEFRGKGLGNKLFNETIKYGDFSFAKEGTRDSTKLLSVAFDYKVKFYFKDYYRLLNPIGYFKSLSNSIPKKFIKTLYCATKNLNKKINTKHYKDLDIKFEHYSRNQTLTLSCDKTVFMNAQEKNYIDWIMGCPLLETYGFVMKTEQFSCLVICYINTNKKNMLRSGRIVHISYLGNDIAYWLAALSKIEDFFREKNCYIISTSATHPINIKALKEIGYYPSKGRGKAFSLRDPDEVLKDVSVDSWHITFMEGDHGYRGV